MKQVFVFCACALIGTQAAAQQVVDLAPETVTEASPDRTLISKTGWLRGVHVIGEDLPEAARPRIEAFVPSGWRDGFICLRVTTNVGTYTSSQEYFLRPDWTAERANLLYGGKQKKLVATFTPDNAGIAVEKGRCFGDEAPAMQEFSANFSNDRSELILNQDGYGELQLNMNITRADELFAKALLGPDEEQLSVDCAPVGGPNAIAINYRCRILVSREQFERTRKFPIVFTHTRMHRQRESKPRSALIHVGSGQ